MDARKLDRVRITVNAVRWLVIRLGARGKLAVASKMGCRLTEWMLS